MKKKIFALLFIFSIILTAFSGCSGGGSAAPSQGAGSAASGGAEKESHDPVTLSMWIWDDAQAPAMNNMAKAFTEKYPWITVEVTSVAGVDEFNMKMQSVMGTPDAPDVFWINFNLSKEYIPKGFVQDLTDYIEKDESVDISKLNAGITKAYTVDGKLYAIPKDIDSFAVYFNKGLFDAAGVAYPDGSWNIEQFAETAKKVTTKETMGWTNSTSDRVYYNFMISNGGKIYSDDGKEALVNSPECVQAVQVLFDMVKNGYAYNGAQLEEVSDTVAFTSGVAAMTINGSWMISQYAEALGDKLGIAEVPSGKVGKASTGHGIGYATTTAGKHPEETWKFLSYLASDEAQEMQVEVVIPAANSAASKWESVYPKVNVGAFVKALDYSYPYLTDYNATVTRTTFQEYLAKMRGGEFSSAQEAMDAAKAAMDKAIAG